MFYSDPMPGENFENSAEREKALTEKEAIKNGENFNPNLSEEAAEGYENMGAEVPFAGEDPYADNTVEKVSEGSPAAQMIAAEYEAGKTADLDGVEQSVNANYIDGAAEAALNDADAVAAQAEAVRETGDGPKDNPYAPKQDSQPEALVVAGAASAIAVDAEAEKALESPDPLDNAKLEQDLQQVENVLEKAESSAEKNADSREAVISQNLIDQSREKIEEARAKAEQAAENQEKLKEEFGEMDTETKEKIEEQAELNGTTAFEMAQKLAAEEERKKAEAEASIRKDVDSFIAGGLFG